MTQAPIATVDRFIQWTTAHTLHDKPLAAYLLAVVFMLIALAIRLAIAPIEAGLQFVTFFPAVTLAAVAGGWRPGLLATLIGMWLATWIFTPPYWVIDLESLTNSLWSNLVFLLDGCVVSFSIDAMHRYRKQYQAELTESQLSENNLQALMAQREADFVALQKFEAIIRSTDDAIISTSFDGIIESWNPGAEKIFGYTAQDAIGKSMLMLIPAERTQEEAGIFSRIARGGHIEHFEAVRRRKDGRLAYLSISVSPILNGERQVIGVSEIARDMTEQHAAAEELRKSNERINSIINTMVDGLISIDERGMMETFNPAAERIFGYAAAEVTGKNVNMLMPEPYRSQHDAYLSRYLATGEPHILGAGQSGGREVTGQRKDGSTFPMALAVSEMLLGERRYFTGIVHDISVRKHADDLQREAKERAEQASRIKAAFLASMSHEIRTPLGGMLGMLELLSMSHLDAEQTATLETAWASGRGLLRIVNDILDWSKIEESKLEITPMPTALEPLLQDVANTYSYAPSAKSLIMRQHVDSRLATAYLVDQLRLSQVLNNFVSNAFKFTEQGEIELRAELLESQAAGDLIRFSVKDTGIGISKEDQKNLFQNYSQASADTARLYGGTGLGLAICRRLAEMMGGELGLLSEPGRGSVFSITLTLPRSDSIVEMPVPRHSDVAQRGIQPLFTDGMDAPLVLVVDDHPTNRELLARQIKMLGLSAQTAENGRAGVSLWRDGRFAMVITDCHMPDMDGYEMTKSIRKIEATEGRARIPVIAWTANALSEEQERIEKAGMDELLVKPVNLRELRRMLSKWLMPHGHSRENIGEDAGAELSRPGFNPSSQTPSPIDYSVLDTVMTDKSEQKTLLHNFINYIRTDRIKLGDVLAQNDRAAVQSAAHRMKGSCRMVGAARLGDACDTIEQSARQGNLDAAHATVAALDAAIHELETFIK